MIKSSEGRNGVASTTSLLNIGEGHGYIYAEMGFNLLEVNLRTEAARATSSPVRGSSGSTPEPIFPPTAEPVGIQIGGIVNLTTNEMASSMVEADMQEQGVGEVAHHIHMPNPSLWPLMAAIAVLLTVVFLLALNSAPWLLPVGAVLVIIGILGWGLEDPFAPRGVSSKRRLPMTYEEAAMTGRPTALAERVLESAQDVADEIVTVSSPEWSAHPVKVEIEQEGVVLALYGKVELEAQRKELQEKLLHMPGVIDVKNFIVAEDTILNAINARIEKLKADGKLQGAKNIQTLVENYIVHLYGETPTPQMKYLLERELVGIPGVRVVVNHIGLNEDIPGNLGKTKNR